MTIAIWVLAAILGYFVWRKHGSSTLNTDLKKAARQGMELLPRILLVIFVAGFAVRLLPPGFIAGLIGPESGIKGVFYAMLAGILIPGGASIAFSVVILLAEAGTGSVQLITLLTSWSVFALHRVLIYEIPLMGMRFAMVRLIVSLPLPLIAAGISALLFELIRP